MIKLDRTDAAAAAEYATVYLAFELSKAKWKLGVRPADRWSTSAQLLMWKRDARIMLLIFGIRQAIFLKIRIPPSATEWHDGQFAHGKYSMMSCREGRMPHHSTSSAIRALPIAACKRVGTLGSD